MMYTTKVKRLQMYMDEDLDEVLTIEAKRSGRSKAELIRECVAARYRRREADPVDLLVGLVEGGAADSCSVGQVVYSR
jgi:hypothetical protein